VSGDGEEQQVEDRHGDIMLKVTLNLLKPTGYVINQPV
jgi:hypothetical protein